MVPLPGRSSEPIARCPSPWKVGSCIMSAGGQRSSFTILGAYKAWFWSEVQAWANAGYLRAYEETNE